MKESEIKQKFGWLLDHLPPYKKMHIAENGVFVWRYLCFEGVPINISVFDSQLSSPASYSYKYLAQAMWLRMHKDGRPENEDLANSLKNIFVPYAIGDSELLDGWPGED